MGMAFWDAAVGAKPSKGFSPTPLLPTRQSTDCLTGRLPTTRGDSPSQLLFVIFSQHANGTTARLAIHKKQPGSKPPMT